MNGERLIHEDEHYAIRLSFRPPAAVVFLEGFPSRLDYHERSAAIAAALDEQRWTRLVFDLTGAEYAGSVVFRLIGSFWQTYRQDDGGRHVALVAEPGTMIREKIELIRFGRLLPIFDDLPSALAGPSAAGDAR
jgi:anti-anti-sigma regulatory factor